MATRATEAQRQAQPAQQPAQPQAQQQPQPNRWTRLYYLSERFALRGSQIFWWTALGVIPTFLGLFIVARGSFLALAGFPLFYAGLIIAYNGLGELDLAVDEPELGERLVGEIVSVGIILGGLMISGLAIVMLARGSLLAGLFTISWFSVAFFFFAYWVLADTAHNLFFTRVHEGRAKIIVTADGFDKALLQLRDHVLDHQWKVVPVSARHPALPRWRQFARGRILGSFHYYGSWPFKDVYVYRFKWAHLNREGQLVWHDEEIDYILVTDYVYAFPVAEIEDKEGVVNQLVMLATIRIENPEKALFRIQTKWLPAVEARLSADVIQEVLALRPILEWFANRAELTRELTAKLRQSPVLRYMRSTWGVWVRVLEVRQITAPPAIQEAVQRPVVAGQQAREVVIRADAEQQRLTREGFGRAAALRAQYEALGAIPTLLDAGLAPVQRLALAIIDAIIKGRGEAGGAAAPGGVPPSTPPTASMTPEQFRALQELLERFRREQGGN